MQTPKLRGGGGWGGGGDYVYLAKDGIMLCPPIKNEKGVIVSADIVSIPLLFSILLYRITNSLGSAVAQW